MPAPTPARALLLCFFFAVSLAVFRGGYTVLAGVDAHRRGQLSAAFEGRTIFASVDSHRRGRLSAGVFEGCAAPLRILKLFFRSISGLFPIYFQKSRLYFLFFLK